MTLSLPNYKHNIPKHVEHLINFNLSSRGGHSNIFCIFSILVYVLQKQIHHHHFSIMIMYTESRPNQQAKCCPQITILIIFMKHKIITESGLFRINLWKIISWACSLKINNAILWPFLQAYFLFLKTLQVPSSGDVSCVLKVMR